MEIGRSKGWTHVSDYARYVWHFSCLLIILLYIDAYSTYSSSLAVLAFAPQCSQYPTPTPCYHAYFFGSLFLVAKACDIFFLIACTHKTDLLSTLAIQATLTALATDLNSALPKSRIHPVSAETSRAVWLHHNSVAAGTCFTLWSC